MTVEGLSTIRYLTTASFGFGASALLAEVLTELAIARPLVVTDPGVRAIGIADGVVMSPPTESGLHPPTLVPGSLTRSRGCAVAVIRSGRCI